MTQTLLKVTSDPGRINVLKNVEGHGQEIGSQSQSEMFQFEIEQINDIMEDFFMLLVLRFVGNHRKFVLVNYNLFRNSAACDKK